MRIKLTKAIVLLVIAIAAPLVLQGQVLIYRQLPELPISQVFKVEIRQGSDNFQQVITYGVPPSSLDYPALVTKVEHISMFAFEPSTGPLDIKITSLTGATFDQSSIELVNKMYNNVTVSFAGNAMYINVLTPKKQLFVRLKGDKGNPLNLFIDPIKESTISPTATVVRFTARDSAYVQRATYDRYTVPNNVDVVYIEDGALIKGTIHTDAGRTKPLKLMGRGVVIGNGDILHNAVNIPYNAIGLEDGSGNSIEGITVMKSRHFMMGIGNNAHIDNVKLIGYNSNNDGIVAGNNSLIENSFFKVCDDNIKFYNNYVQVQNCVFYVQNNGGIFQFAWNSIDPGDYCVAQNCEVVAVEYTFVGDPASGTGGTSRTFISIAVQNSDNKRMSTDTIKNIIVQGQLIRFMGLNGYADKGFDISGLVVQNINVLNPPTSNSWVYTKPTYTVGIKFNNVVFGNRAIAQSDFTTLGSVNLQFDQLNNPYTGKFIEPENTTTSAPKKEINSNIKIYTDANFLNIYLPAGRIYSQYSVYKYTGEKILSGKIKPQQQILTIPVNSINAGCYILKVDDYSCKFIK